MPRTQDNFIHLLNQQPSKCLITNPFARFPQTWQLRKPETPTNLGGISRSNPESFPYFLSAITKYTENVWVFLWYKPRTISNLPKMAFHMITWVEWKRWQRNYSCLKQQAKGLLPCNLGFTEGLTERAAFRSLGGPTLAEARGRVKQCMRQRRQAYRTKCNYDTNTTANIHPFLL